LALVLGNLSLFEIWYLEIEFSLVMLRQMVKHTIHHNNEHIPVLLDAVIDLLKPQKGEKYLDLTAGYGGHARAIMEKVGAVSNLTLVDRDENAIKTLKEFNDAGAKVIHSDYFKAAQDLVNKNERFDLILMDIGVSSPHLDRPERGFSFQQNGPLDMRMDQSSGVTAKQLIDHSSIEDLERVLKEYGEEPQAKRIAKLLVESRPINTTKQLAELVEKHIGRRGKIHPATRTFQALRIAVNDELEQLRATLPLAVDLLNHNGRLAVISFHSLEDRLVKDFFKEEALAGYESRLKLINKNPISGATEDVLNRRARSAKLRAVIKINT
jgi:16S rRNA (cytosine1402-N4)-methyltransferase